MFQTPTYGDEIQPNNWVSKNLKLHLLRVSSSWLLLYMDNPTPTVQKFEDAIKNALSARQIEVLQILYSFPNASATAKQLTEVISPFSTSVIVINGIVGKIGKAISNHTGYVPPTYFNGKTDVPAYFFLIGKYYKDTGWNMWQELQEALENLNLVSDDNTDIIERLPTETFQFAEQRLFKEGKIVQVFVTRYERNQKARLECIKHHGDNCFVCGFNFGQYYGDVAKGFIHVHHMTPLADIGEEYEVDPTNDLVPVCANCHSVIHLTNPAMTIEELKKLTKKSSR